MFYDSSSMSAPTGKSPTSSTSASEPSRIMCCTFSRNLKCHLAPPPRPTRSETGWSERSSNMDPKIRQRDCTCYYLDLPGAHSQIAHRKTTFFDDQRSPQTEYRGVRCQMLDRQ